MIDDEEIGEQIRRSAERAAADIPTRYPTPEFYAGVGRPEHMPRRYVAYAVAAAAAVVAVVFGVVVLQDPDTASVDTASPVALGPDAMPTATHERFDPIAVQIAADTEIAADLGLTIGPLVFDDDDTLAEDGQPDLVPLEFDGELIGYARPAESQAPEVTAYNVYGPDGVTIRGVVDVAKGYVPLDPDS